jgi:farnesyl diphosphate synthase
MTENSAHWLAHIEQSLDGFLPASHIAPTRLHEAMRYACIGGGKRLRAQLVYATGALFDCQAKALDNAAVAVEMIHAYSLIHDDLPAMDNDDLRRGKATVHIAFDQATAILAGDALQTCAFSTLLNAECNDELKVQLMKTLASATGSSGMCGGQQLDIDASQLKISIEALQKLHAMKTGALIEASVIMGAIIAQATSIEQEALSAFATDLGLAFQIQDDILDIESTTETLGKSAGKDVAQEKSTYPALLGLDASKSLLNILMQQMQTHLSMFGSKAEPLLSLAEFSVQRKS